MAKAKKMRVVDAPNPEAAAGKLKFIGGSKFDDFNNILANSVIQSLWYGSDGKQDVERKTHAALATLASLEPENEIEGMLIAQMIACHFAAMECYRRAMIPEQSFEGRQAALNFANKLSRTYATQLDALNKNRGKGQQKVTVEHVHVHQGGQAIVGTVNAQGGRTKVEEQAHAKTFADAREPEVRGARKMPTRETGVVTGKLLRSCGRTAGTTVGRVGR